MVVKPIFGNWKSIDIIDRIDNPIIITMKEPWAIIKPKINSIPSQVIFNKSMDIEHLEELFFSLKKNINNSKTIIGLGGGTSCDTAKYLTWKSRVQEDLNLNLLLIPSIISVDAFLCSSIAVREENKVNYIGESEPNNIIIDYELIKKAPKYLNRAGVSDTISITSALGDWKIAHEENDEKLNSRVFDKAKSIAENLMKAREDIQYINDNGIKALVDGFYNEVKLCEDWGNARPEEGSEHFLAYCIESITKEHYIHGQIIGLNILISLFLQKQNAEFSLERIHRFFNDIELDISPKSMYLSYEILKKAIQEVKNYIKKENLMYSVYNSSKLDLDKNIRNLMRFIKSI
ncbi:MAG: iron-containing alcohol dehydrogenase [Candidatus Lokiarchaeota archaeon]|nr:iron-containing alcohol dehydrogenase [Candidatus Lokiarchaeota archaeon]MBD3202476.1 iron-containing alcohol dehydrogenase [Candidatus Lokiarchaeota archaeon]